MICIYLVYMQKKLKDSDTLKDYNIQSNNTLELKPNQEPHSCYYFKKLIDAIK